MTTSVLPLRFINTPTVLELYEQEHQGDKLGVAEEDVDKLSDEYNTVAGNEGYYQLLFQHSKAPYSGSRTGNEGLLETARAGIKKVIESVKAFFKWLFSFFVSKKKIAEDKIEDLKQLLDKNGIKQTDVTYPSSAGVLWASKAKIPATLDWVVKALTALGDDITKGETYLKETRTFIEAAGKLQVKGFLAEHKSRYDKLLTEHVASVTKLFSAKTFSAGSVTTVEKTGKVRVNKSDTVGKAGGGTYKTNDTQVRALFKTLEGLNERFEKQVNAATSLEALLVKQLETGVTWAFTLDQKDKPAGESIVGGVKRAVTDAMGTIKQLNTAYFQAISSGLGILEASVDKGK